MKINVIVSKNHFVIAETSIGSIIADAVTIVTFGVLFGGMAAFTIFVEHSWFVDAFAVLLLYLSFCRYFQRKTKVRFSSKAEAMRFIDELWTEEGVRHE